MRRFVFSLTLLGSLTLATLFGFSLVVPVWGQLGPITQINCNKLGNATIATATTTALVNGIAAQGIHICGWHVTSTQSTSTTFQLVYGTQGGPCGTPTVMSAPFSVINSAPSSDLYSLMTLRVRSLRSAGA